MEEKPEKRGSQEGERRTEEGGEKTWMKKNKGGGERTESGNKYIAKNIVWWLHVD